MRYLGVQSPMPTDPRQFELEVVANPELSHFYGARFTLPEFTSLCPVTGQPDFATIFIDYVPDQWLVESKAIKLYAAAFRNVGDFHEACTNQIADKIMDAAKPHLLRVAAFWYPRGGIPIDVLVYRSLWKEPLSWERYLLPLPPRDYRGR